MGALTLALVLAVTDPVASWQPLIGAAAARCGVPEAWIARVMRAESGGRTMLGGVPIRSPKGAIGLMQLMPGTWAEMRAQLGLGTDPDDPHDNIVAGACYLRFLYDRFGYPGLFGAYNAGPGRYSAWLAGRRGLPSETVAYLAKVGPEMASRRAGIVDVPLPTLFVVSHAAPDSPPPREEKPADIFAIRRVAP